MKFNFFRQIGDDKVDIKLKIGREIYNINENDIVMDNGACIQVVTKKVGTLWEGYHSLKMSKKLFNDLKKVNYLYTNDELNKIALEKYEGVSVTLYKFDIERMCKAGY